MLPCRLPYIRNIRKTIHTTIGPNHNSNNINNNNNNNNSESNYSASLAKKPAVESEEAVSESAVCKVIIEKKGSGQTSQPPSEEVKVGSAEVVFGTPHPMRRRRVRPDSPHVDGRVWSRRGEGGRCEKISEKEEEVSDSENNPKEGSDGDYGESDSVFEEESGNEEGSESEETRCPKIEER